MRQEVLEAKELRPVRAGGGVYWGGGSMGMVKPLETLQEVKLEEIL